ncbi:MAG: DNA alkylation repair protein [Solirubrobacterales bacterium]
MPTADELLGAAVVEDLVAQLAAADRRRNWATVAASSGDFAGQGLGERVQAVKVGLLTDLPAGFPAAARVIRKALRDPALSGWMIWPLSEAIAERAADSEGEDFETGLALLAELTGRLTCEFALRRFLNADLDRTLATVLTWTAHRDEHVRRLASEGTRPRLPWAKRVPALTARPAATLPILEALHRDGSEYVRRSVANHLNDVSRLDPALALATAAAWLREEDPQSTRLVKRALRTLVKEADQGALALFGFAPARQISVDGIHLEPTTVAVGGALGFEATIANEGTEPVELMVDYVVHHRKASGELTPKVFKLTTKRLEPGERLTLSRRHSFKPITTRRYHPGPHAIELQVNGARHGRADFELVA